MILNQVNVMGKQWITIMTWREVELGDCDGETGDHDSVVVLV